MKEFAISIVKKMLGIKARNSLKVFIFKHPYIFGRESFLKKKAYTEELENILSQHKNVKGIIVYPSISDWDMPLTQRFQHLAEAFAKSGYLFFYGTHNLRYDNIQGFKKLKENLYLTNQLEVLREIKKPILYITWAANNFYRKKYDYSQLIYDYVDDLDMFPLLGNKIVRCHKDLVNKADLVPVTASRLYEEVKQKTDKAILSPNAVNFELFQVGKPSVPKTLKDLVGKKPIIGYFGSLVESCFDYELLKFAAKNRPEYNFVIIGPLDFDKSFEKHKWNEYPNIHFLGRQEKYEDLAICVHFFDVCTVPFLLNNVTQSISPLKLFEYMASGRPIVTTNMRECKKYKSVLVGKNKDEYVSLLDKGVAIKNDADYKALILKEAKENTWEARAVEIIKKLAEEPGKINIGGIFVSPLTKETTVSKVLKAAKENRFFFVVTANAEILNKGLREEKLKKIINSADIVTADGAGTLIASRILGEKLPERVTGVDLTEDLLTLGEKENLSFYFLGSEEKVLEEAVKNLRNKHPRIKIVGFRGGMKCDKDGFIDNEKEIIKDIKESNANFLFVGLGCPKQEKWIFRNQKKLSTVSIGIGGTFGFWAKTEKRAPLLIQKLYIEWLYRLAQNPKRFWRLMTLPMFFYTIIKKRFN